MLVRAKVTHTQPGTQAYRVEGEKFELEGDLYKHVEEVKARGDEEEQPEPERRTKKK